MLVPGRSVTRGQSSVVGLLLLTGIVITVTSVAGYYVLTDAVDAGSEPTTVEIRGTVDAETVRLSHAGGDSLPRNQLRIRLSYDGETQTYDFESDDGCLAAGDGDDRFDPGESWCLDGTPPYGTGDVVRVSLVNTETNEVLYRGRKVARMPTPTVTAGISRYGPRT